MMNEYQQKALTSYARALNQAERILKDNEHEVFHTEAGHLYNITLDLRSALAKIGEEMHRMVFKAQGRKLDNYRKQQAGKWVGLTNDEVNCWELPDTPTVFEFAKFIEAKLKEKNGG